MKMAFGLKKRDAEISLEHIESINVVQINKEEVSIEDLHNDLEKKLQEQGFIFDKKKFITQDEHWTIGQRIADRVANFGKLFEPPALLLGIIAGTNHHDEPESPGRKGQEAGRDQSGKGYC